MMIKYKINNPWKELLTPLLKIYSNSSKLSLLKAATVFKWFLKFKKEIALKTLKNRSRTNYF